MSKEEDLHWDPILFPFKSLGAIRSDRFNEYRKIGRFTDLVLVSSDNKTMNVHKNILCASCPYFDEIFNSNLNEAQTNKIEFKDQDIKMDDLEVIINIIYIGVGQINECDALKIYLHADFFQLAELKKFANKILLSNVRLSNCVQYWRDARLYSIPMLKPQCEAYIIDYSQRFFETLTIILRPEELKAVMSADVNKENEDLLRHLFKWLKDDVDLTEDSLIGLIETYNFKKLANIIS